MKTESNKAVLLIAIAVALVVLIVIYFGDVTSTSADSHLQQVELS